jgi:uncharacterized membrane protein YcaP (DUF421 family)
MVLGDHPLLFSLEIVLRTIIVYAYALLLLRLLGSRTIGQLSTVEFLLVIALGSAVGDAMFYADVPLLHALVVVTVVVGANKVLDVLIAGSSKAERLIDGKPETLIASGILSDKFLHGNEWGRGEVFQQLRRSGIEHLGQVRFAFAEPDGEVTVFKYRDERPGLPIVPPWDIEHPPRWTPEQQRTTLAACVNCGATTPSTERPLAACSNCGHEEWTPAVLSTWHE